MVIGCLKKDHECESCPLKQIQNATKLARVKSAMNDLDVCQSHAYIVEATPEELSEHMADEASLYFNGKYKYHEGVLEKAIEAAKMGLSEVCQPVMLEEDIERVIVIR